MTAADTHRGHVLFDFRELDDSVGARLERALAELPETHASGLEGRQAFDAIEEVAAGRMSRDEARELFGQCLTAHELAATARAALPSRHRHRSGVNTHSTH